jgi:DnaK suppressor protein
MKKLMPSSVRAQEYLSADQREWFRDHINERLTERKQSLLEARQSMEPDTQFVTDDNDRASNEEIMTSIRLNAERLSREINEHGQAINRLNSGDFGWCADTGDAIGLDRLIAMPTATRTVNAQQRQERVRSQYGSMAFA